MITLEVGTVDEVALVCLEHLDVGFTAAPQEVARRQKEHLDHAIALCLERPDFRWTVESIWQLEEWLARTPAPAPREQLVALVKAGRIEIAGAFANFHSGVMDAELLLRGFEPAEAIRRELGVEISAAVQDDVPGFSALLPAAMSAAGIRYFLAGVNTTFGGGTSLGPAKNPFWWEGLDGSRVLTWVAYGSYVEAEAIGLGVWSRPEDHESEAKLGDWLKKLAASGYAFRRVMVMASTGDNGDPDAARSILRKVDAWNANHSTPRISFTTPGAFLKRLEQEAIAATGRPDGGFAVARGDWSGHWEPVKANSPAGTALFREAQALFPGAEALALRGDRELGLPFPQHDLDVALRQLLLCAEHTRPGGVGWPKLTTKADVEAAAQFDFEQAHGAAETLRAIVARVTAEYATRLASDGGRLVVANPSPVAQRFEAAQSVGAIEVPPFTFARAPLPATSTQADDDDAADDARDRDAPRLHWMLPFDAGSAIVDAPPALSTLRRLAHDDERTEWLARIDLGAHELEGERPDPLRFLFTFGLPSGELAWTSAAGVLSDADFLPGGLPCTRCTSGALRVALPPAADDPDRHAREVILLTREAFGFQLGAPRWLGAGVAGTSGPIWLHALDLPLRGETRDQGRVRFERIEPALDDLRDFHFALLVREVDPATPRWQRDAELVRAAAAWRCPLVRHEFTPWFPSPPSDVGTQPLVETSAQNVLVLSCRPSRDRDGLPGGGVLVRVQEIGGVPAEKVDVRVRLPGLSPGPTSGAGASAAQRCDLRAHEVRTLHFPDDS